MANCYPGPTFLLAHLDRRGSVLANKGAASGADKEIQKIEKGIKQEAGGGGRIERGQRLG